MEHSLIREIIDVDIIRDAKSESKTSTVNMNIMKRAGSLPILKTSIKNTDGIKKKSNKNAHYKNIDMDGARDEMNLNKMSKSMTSTKEIDILECISMAPQSKQENGRNGVNTSDGDQLPKQSKIPHTQSNEIHIIKATSVSQKMSINVQEECVRTVGDVSIAVDGFGLITTNKNTEIVKRFTFTNKNKMQVQVISLGATVTSIHAPDKNGKIEDIALGFDSIEDYFGHSNPNIGCTLGRDAFDTLQDDHYNGLGLYNWVSSLDDSKLILTHISEDGWHGHRGTVMIRAIFELKKDNSFHVSFWATSTAMTAINLSLNLFLNLAGHAAKHTELYKHIFTINGDKSIKERTYKLSKFKPQYVGGTVYDLRTPHEIGPVIARSPQSGFDKYYILTKGTEQTISFAARVIHPESGRFLELYTDQGGIQFYTADYFPDNTTYDIIPIVNESNEDKDITFEESSLVECSSQSLESPFQSKVYEIKGKNGANYMRHGAFCINSLNLPSEFEVCKNLQNNILIPGHTYEHRIIYKFGVVVD